MVEFYIITIGISRISETIILFENNVSIMKTNGYVYDISGELLLLIDVSGPDKLVVRCK